MKPIVITILGGLVILMLFSSTNTSSQHKTISANKAGIVRSIIKPAQSGGVFDVRLGRFGF